MSDSILLPTPEPKRKHVRKPGSSKPGPPRMLLTVEEKAQAVTLAASGWSQSLIGKKLQRHRSTVKKYLEEPGTMDRVNKERTELAELYKQKARDCVIAIDDEKIAKSSALQLATSSGILLDKSLLLSGAPTANIAVLIEIAAHIRRDEDVEYHEAKALPSLPANQTPPLSGAS